MIRNNKNITITKSERKTAIKMALLDVCFIVSIVGGAIFY